MLLHPTIRRGHGFVEFVDDHVLKLLPSSWCCGPVRVKSISSPYRSLVDIAPMTPILVTIKQLESRDIYLSNPKKGAHSLSEKGLCNNKRLVWHNQKNSHLSPKRCVLTESNQNLKKVHKNQQKNASFLEDTCAFWNLHRACYIVSTPLRDEFLTTSPMMLHIL